MNMADLEVRVPKALVLQIQISALREALASVTDPAAPGVIYGRIDSLVTERQAALESLMREQADAFAMAGEAQHVPV